MNQVVIKSIQCWVGKEVQEHSQYCQEISGSESNYSWRGLKIHMHAPFYRVIHEEFFQKVAPDRGDLFKKRCVSGITTIWIIFWCKERSSVMGWAKKQI